MNLDEPNFLIPLAALVTGLAAGLILGAALGYRAGRRRRSLAIPLNPDGQNRLEALARAQRASELATTELRQALDQMEQAAGTDRLTGTWNRRWFEDGATQLIALSGRGDDALSLILLDLDLFKHINDTFGHGVGDEVLKSITGTVRDQLRASDALARWGGEEFVVLCPATTLAGATILAEKIRRAVETRSIPQMGVVTISLGVAQHQKAETLDAWVHRADEALYRAKERGRNRTEASLGSVNRARGMTTPSVLALTWDPCPGMRPPGDRSSAPAALPPLQQPPGLHHGWPLSRATRNSRCSCSSPMWPSISTTRKPSSPGRAMPTCRRMRRSTTGSSPRPRLLQQKMDGVSTDLPAVLGFLSLDLLKGHFMAWDRKFFEDLTQA